MKQLPERFCESMRALLGEEYPQYAASLSEKPRTALRVNTGKITLEEWGRRNPFSTSEVSWTEKGFYFDAGQDRPSKHPYYYAGLYYIQEPSAMVPAALLPVFPGEKVLDLCAAPGGKATELGAKLLGRGLLVANDISVSRAMALAKNVQMAGIVNAVVTAEKPEKLAVVFPEFFDKILVDAPCSGEGMFRREPTMAREWEKCGPAYYEKIQKQILSEAYHMLKPGGMLVYSTCTFSAQENEGVVQWLLDGHRDLKIVPVERKEGFSEGRPDMVSGGSESLRECVRIFPHRAGGEGHFAVLLQKGKKTRQRNWLTGRIPEPDMVKKYLQIGKGKQAGNRQKRKEKSIWESKAKEKKHWQQRGKKNRGKQRREAGNSAGNSLFLAVGGKYVTRKIPCVCCQRGCLLSLMAFCGLSARDSLSVSGNISPSLRPSLRWH